VPHQNDLGAFARRELEDVRDEVYEKDLEPLSAYDYFPTRTADESKEFHVIRQYDRIGYSRWYSQVANEFPRADAVIDEDQFPIHQHVVAYGYTRKEMKRARSGESVDLETKRGAAAMRAIRERNNFTAVYGDSAMGLFGALTFASTPRVYFQNPINRNTNAETIVDEIRACIDTPNEVTRNQTEIDYFALPTAQYNHIRGRRMPGNSDQTVLSYLSEIVYGADNADAPNITFIKMPELEGAGPNGEDVCFGFRNDQRTWGNTIAEPFTQEDPMQPNRLCWEIQCHSMTAGVSADYPLRNVIGILAG
jgi:hypothetical protein